MICHLTFFLLLQGAKTVYTRLLRPVFAQAKGQVATPAAPSAAAHTD